jgi:chorismate synthase
MKQLQDVLASAVRTLGEHHGERLMYVRYGFSIGGARVHRRPMLEQIRRARQMRRHAYEPSVFSDVYAIVSTVQLQTTHGCGVPARIVRSS